MKKSQGFTKKYHLHRGLEHRPESTNSKEKANDPTWRQPSPSLGVHGVRDGNTMSIPLDVPFVESLNFAEAFVLQVLLFVV